MIQKKQRTFLDVVKERNERENSDREFTDLDILRKRRRLLKTKQTRENINKPKSGTDDK
jgi:hypothetical protein